MRKLLYLAFAILLSACTEEDEGWSLKAGDPVPQFKVTMNDGSVVTTESLRGHTSVIVFFNTTCSDCRQELPIIQRAYEEHPDIQFVCIAREQDAADIAEYWAAHNLTLPYAAQTDRYVYNKFASATIPRVYVISPELIITKSMTP